MGFIRSLRNLREMRQQQQQQLGSGSGGVGGIIKEGRRDEGVGDKDMVKIGTEGGRITDET